MLLAEHWDSWTRHVFGVRAEPIRPGVRNDVSFLLDGSGQIVEFDAKLSELLLQERQILWVL